MPYFLVRLTATSEYLIELIAEDAEEATRKVEEMDAQDLEDFLSDVDFVINSVEEEQ